MQKITLLLLLLGGSTCASAQNNPCSNPDESLICTTLFEYDAAGNRTVRKEVCYCGMPQNRPAARIARAANPAITEPQHAAAISKIFPNPTNSTITVLFSENISKGLLAISDATGKQIEAFAINSAEVKIDISQYPAGAYFLTLRTDTAINTQRIVKIE